MEVMRLVTDERAVSPVIAVVLMIAVSVILLAIIGTFALQLDGGEGTPRVEFDFEWDDGGTDAGVDATDDTLVITHEGGDSLPADQVDVLVNGAVDTSGTWEGVDPIVTGTTYTIDESGTDIVGENDEIRVTWTGEDGQGATLGVYKIPG